jgi:hypothetical protein
MFSSLQASFARQSGLVFPIQVPPKRSRVAFYFGDAIIVSILCRGGITEFPSLMFSSLRASFARQSGLVFPIQVPPKCNRVAFYFGDAIIVNVLRRGGITDVPTLMFSSLRAFFARQSGLVFLYKCLQSVIVLHTTLEMQLLLVPCVVAFLQQACFWKMLRYAQHGNPYFCHPEPHLRRIYRLRVSTQRDFATLNMTR